MITYNLCFVLFLALANGLAISDEKDSGERTYHTPDLVDDGPHHTLSSSLEDKDEPAVHPREKRLTSFYSAAKDPENDVQLKEGKDNDDINVNEMNILGGKSSAQKSQEGTNLEVKEPVVIIDSGIINENNSEGGEKISIFKAWFGDEIEEMVSEAPQTQETLVEKASGSDEAMDSDSLNLLNFFNLLHHIEIEMAQFEAGEAEAATELKGVAEHLNFISEDKVELPEETNENVKLEATAPTEAEVYSVVDDFTPFTVDRSPWQPFPMYATYMSTRPSMDVMAPALPEHTASGPSDVTIVVGDVKIQVSVPASPRRLPYPYTYHQM